MKIILLAAALSVSSLALAQGETTDDAQTSTDTTATTGTETMGTDQGTTGTATDTGTAADAGMQTGGAMPMGGGGGSVAPSNANPERDARGIPVVSDAAEAPPGTNAAPPAGGGRVVPNPNQAAAFSTQSSTENYVPCSKTVTDNCVQTYERGSRR